MNNIISVKYGSLIKPWQWWNTVSSIHKTTFFLYEFSEIWKYYSLCYATYIILYNEAPIVDFHGKDIFLALFQAQTYIPLQFSHEFPYTNITRYTFMDVKNKQNKTLCCKQYETWKYKNPITHYRHTDAELYRLIERRRRCLRENSFIKKNLCFIHITVIDPHQPSRLFSKW